MSRKMRSGEDTLLKDKDGKSILVHSHVADSKGDVYYVNCFCQAVPKGDGVAVELAELVRDGDVRVLSAEEVLAMQKPAAQKPEAKPLRKRRKPLETVVESPVVTKAPADPVKPEEEPTKDDIMAELRLVIGTIPDKMLADELRRRGYVFSAVKPAIINI